MVDKQKTGRQHGREHRKLWITLLVMVPIAAGPAPNVTCFIRAEPAILHTDRPDNLERLSKARHTRDFDGVGRPSTSRTNHSVKG